MVQTPGYFPSAALFPVGAHSAYVASGAHYEVVARRIVAALRDGGRPVILVTGNPPADPRVLSAALGNVAGARYAVAVISCGPELKRADLERSVHALAAPKAGGEVVAAPVLPLFVLADFDRLSDRQIEDLLGGMPRRDPLQSAAVLLASLDFQARLERPGLQFLKHCIAQLHFQEVGDDEAITVLHGQLLAQRDRRVEARGFRRGILIGSAVGGVAIIASIGIFMLHSTAEPVYEAPAGIGSSNSASNSESEEAPFFPPTRGSARRGVTEQTAAPTETASAPTAPPPPPVPALAAAAPRSPTVPALATALPAPPASALATQPPAPPLPPPKMENQLATTRPAPVPAPAGPDLSAAVITALLARGDAFFGAGDIISARLCYERAANAESGRAALRLATTYDPIVLGRAGLRGVTADPVHALSWYRRARDLGVAEAEQRIKALELRPIGEADPRPR
jgi:hypothetical protein